MTTNKLFPQELYFNDISKNLFINRQDVSPILTRQFNDDKKITYSRDGQDRYVIDHIFHGKKNGYFLDIGAYDGISESNTYLLENYFDWIGICCECDPRSIERLREVRSYHVMNIPIYKTTGHIIGFELHKSHALSGISDHLRSNYHDSQSKVINMITVSLMDCLKYYHAPKTIDYMSLDTEGSEYEILSSFDFDQYRVNYIGVEHNYQSPKRENIRELLESHGYIYHRSIMHDDDYILKDYAIKNHIPI